MIFIGVRPMPLEMKILYPSLLISLKNERPKTSHSNEQGKPCVLVVNLAASHRNMDNVAAMQASSHFS